MSKAKSTSATTSKRAGTKAAAKSVGSNGANGAAGTIAKATGAKRAASAKQADKRSAKRAAPKRTTAKAQKPVAARGRTAAVPKPAEATRRTAAAPKAAARRSAAAAVKPPAKSTARGTARRATKTAPGTGAAAAPVSVAEPEAVAADESVAAAGVHGDLKFQVSDGLRLHYKVWRPDGPAQRLVILVHGFADHSDRFSYLVPHLVERGAVVYAYDQRGQGRSPGRTGHVMKFQRLIDDLETFVRLACEREAGIPHFIYAHSTGAIAALHYLYATPLAVDGAVLSAPCLMLTFDPPAWKSTLGKTISSVVPGFTMQAGFDPGTVSRDEVVVSANKTDTLVSQKMTARFYTEVYLKAMPAALERIDQLKTPYLVIQGTEDRLVSPTVADEFERRAAAHGTVIRYEGGYHESHNDIHREQVFADLDEWFDAGGPRPRAKH